MQETLLEAQTKAFLLRSALGRSNRSTVVPIRNPTQPCKPASKRDPQWDLSAASNRAALKGSHPMVSKALATSQVISRAIPRVTSLRASQGFHRASSQREVLQWLPTMQVKRQKPCSQSCLAQYRTITLHLPSQYLRHLSRSSGTAKACIGF